MATENIIVKTILEKHAASAWANPIKWYKETAAKPSFKAKKIVGKVLAAGLGAGYVANKVMRAPEAERSPTSPYMGAI